VRLIVAIAALWALVAVTSVAEAYPQFQLVHEGSCGTCHLSPAGGGLLNDYGRDEAGSTISRGGDGRLLHGAWDPPDWFAIGGDFRFAAAGKRLQQRNDLLMFPMQADVNLRMMRGGFAFAFTAGVRGVARGDQDEQPVLLERLASREHYVAYAFGERQIRAGRFFPVFGLRLVDHTAFVRRFMGFNLFEEPYAVELAHYGDKTELHVTGFVPQPIELLGSGLRRSGGSAQIEHRFADELVLGAQGRVAVGPYDAVATLGTTAKRWFPEAEVLLLGELDVQRETFRGNGPGRTQLAGYGAASKWATRGVLLSSAVHLWEPDLTLRSTSRLAFEVAAQYFPWAHVELHLLLRASAQGGVVEDPGYLSLLQVHYYP
jgi:hypothetical protein